MLPKDALAKMQYEPADFYRVGKRAVEFMTSYGDKLAELKSEWAQVKLQVSGECAFTYNDEEFRTVEDLDGRPDVVLAMQNEKIYYDDYPSYVIKYFDGKSAYIDDEISDMEHLPMELELKAILIHELRTALEFQYEEMPTEVQAFYDALYGFQAMSVRLKSIIRVDSIQRMMHEFLLEHPDLLNVLGTVEMDSGKDDYETKWFTVFFHCENDQARADVLAQMKTYGTLV